MPAVSVIIPVYKVERYIERCARSLFSQTLEDIEYIFVNDCSPDRSVEILEKVLEDFPQRKSQVKIISNPENRGVSYTRMKGAENATGDYVIHCDSDDWPDPEMYAKMYSKAVSENLDMVICGARRVYPDSSSVTMRGITSTDDLLESLLYLDVFTYTWNKLVTRKAYENNIRYPEHNMLDDAPLMVQLAYHCRNWGFIEECLYNYYYCPDSISSAWDSMEKVEQIHANIELVFSFLDSKGLREKYGRAIMHLKCWTKFAALQLPRKYYLNLYPEANLPFFFDNRFTVVERMGHLTKILGIHGISKPFKRKR